MLAQGGLLGSNGLVCHGRNQSSWVETQHTALGHGQMMQSMAEYLDVAIPSLSWYLAGVRNFIIQFY